jgi:chemotaxis signal transduction protein
MVLTFQVENELYGIETFRVREVLKYSELRPPTPARDPWEGDLVLRGGVFPVLSFRKFLGLGPLPQAPGTWFIVLEKKGFPFILWVDHVREVSRLKIDQIEPCPPYLFGKKNELYYCLGKIKEDIYSILNPDKLVDEKSFSLPSSEVDYAFPP